ncbi:MAG: acyloxyacyl hydrolase [Thermoanaerobaculia bacterium]
MVEKEIFLKSIGFLTGYGGAKVEEGRYQVYHFNLQLGTDASNIFKKLKKERGFFLLYMEPRYASSIKPENDYEFGLGLGIKYLKPLGRKFFYSLSYSTGPHYFTLRTEDQARGFLFSHNIDLGLYFYFEKERAFYFGYRFNHMSNANFRRPNMGINGNFVFLGISFNLK